MTAPKTKEIEHYLSPGQVDAMLRPIHPNRVFETEGQSNVAAWEIRAHLNRVFGFGRWSGNVLAMELIYDQPTQTRAGKPAFNVAYRCAYQLDLHAPDGTHIARYTEWAMGSSTMPDFKHADCHDMAMKTAESQALKRCAINLGDQFGLGLYDKFNQLYNPNLPPRERIPSPVVKGVLVGATVAEAPDPEHKVAGEHDPDHPDADNQDNGEEPQTAPQATDPPSQAQPPTGTSDRPAEQPAAPAETPPNENTPTTTLSPEEEVVVRRGELLEAINNLSPEALRILRGNWRPAGMQYTPDTLPTKELIEKAWGLLNRAVAEANPNREAEIRQAQNAFYGNK